MTYNELSSKDRGPFCPLLYRVTDALSGMEEEYLPGEKVKPKENGKEKKDKYQTET
jgi:hypothetical protein